MLSIGVLQSSAQAGNYYAQDNYYTKDTQAGGSEAGDGVGGPSLWDGTGAQRLGLTGAVEQGQFERLLNGELPNGVVLKRGQQGKHQPGWDLTFSAPKSVSLLALVAGDSRVVEAHNLAVSEALRYLEATTAQARIKQEGKSAIEATANWIIARFTHDTSRELDPQLHTHAVVINATRRADGEWRALSSKEIFRAKMVGGAIYRAELAIEAGRPFAMLLERGMAFTEMRQVKRQTNPVLTAAVMDSIARREAAAIKKLAGHTYTIPDRDARLDAMVQNYLARPNEHREQTLIVTGVNEDRREINERIRNALRDEQVLKGPEASAMVLVQRDLTRAELTQAKSYQIGDIVRFGRSYARLGIGDGDCLRVARTDIDPGVVLDLQRGAQSLPWEPRRAAHVEVYREESRTLMVGDRLRWTRNDRELGRRNGETAVVLSVDAATGMATVAAREKIVMLDLRHERHWEHAYASTVHAAQGRTVDQVLVHLDTKHEKTLGAESFYVAISRARIEANLYVNDKSGLARALEQSRRKPYALEAMDPGLSTRFRARTVLIAVRCIWRGPRTHQGIRIAQRIWPAPMPSCWRCPVRATRTRRTSASWRKAHSPIGQTVEQIHQEAGTSARRGPGVRGAPCR